jgi:ribosomal protein S18 acetylase RimI-like enzyme
MGICLYPAKDVDLSAVAVLMNTAFRGTASERSWSVEAGYITGQRTNVSLLREEIAEGSHLLLAKDEVTSDLQGCVRLYAVSPEKWHLGSLTVAPALQNAGMGRTLLCAAEEYAAVRGARVIEITVLSVRDTLISWYERRGYRRSGETRPFPYEDTRFGTPTRDDLEFAVLEKSLRE